MTNRINYEKNIKARGEKIMGDTLAGWLVEGELPENIGGANVIRREE